MRQRIIILAVAAALLAAACGSNDSGDNATSTDDPATADTTDADTTDGATTDGETPDSEGDGEGEGGSADGATLTAAEIGDMLFPSMEDFQGAEAEARFADEQRAQEELVGECMRNLGFEYTPVDYGSFAFFGAADDLDPSSREWAETYGLGMSTFAFDEATLGEGIEDEFVDPNQEYVEGLSDSARDAYYEALYGPQNFSELDTENETEITSFEPMGCQGEAFVATSSFAGLDTLYAEFGDQLEDLYERVEADPRMREVSDRWVTCMGEAGYTYNEPDDMYEDISSQMDELFQETYGSFEESFESGTDFDESSETHSDDSTDPGLDFEPPQPDAEKLAALQDQEIAVAVASFDCGLNDGTTVFEEIASEYTDKFIAENLSALQAALAEG